MNAEFDPEVESALAGVERPAACPKFRERLRARFCSEVAPAPPISFADEAARRRQTLLRIGGLIAAGLILAVGFIFLQSPAPRWRVLDLAAGSVVKADGKPVPSDDPTELARVLQHARDIEVEKGDLVVQVDDLSLFDLGEGTHVAFTGFLRSAPGNPYEIRAMSGRLRARTGPGLSGHTMRVNADVMEVTVTGTAFAIDYEEPGTCVCCLHGGVQVTAKAMGSDPKPVPPERMCLVYRGSHESEGAKWGGSPEKHAAPLKALEARALEIWPAAAPR